MRHGKQPHYKTIKVYNTVLARVNKIVVINISNDVYIFTRMYTKRTKNATNRQYIKNVMNKKGEIC